MLKRIVCAMLVCCLCTFLCSGLDAYAASEEKSEESEVYTDFSKFTDIGDHWAKDALKWGVDNGLMTGTSATTMSPDGTMTRAEMATLLTRAFGITKEADISMFIDVSKDDWYYSAIAKAVQLGCLSVFGNSIAPNEPVTRQEIAVSIVKAAGYNLDSSSNLGKYPDNSQVDSWAQDYVATAVSNGLLSGYSDGRLAPKDNVTRAQFITLMQRMAVAYMTPTATYTSKTVNGSLVVGVGNISLDNMTISGNLFLTDGVGSGNVTLNNTVVSGTIFVRGASSSVVTLKGNSRAGNVIMQNANSAIQLVVEDSSYVSGTTYITEANSSVTLTGSVGDVQVNTGKAPVKLSAASVDMLLVNARLAAVSVDKDSEVNSLIVPSGVYGVDLDLDGKISSITTRGTDAHIILKGDFKELIWSNIGSNASVTFASDCSIGTVRVDSNNVEQTLGGTAEAVEISGDACVITFDGTAAIKTLNVSGDKSDIKFLSAAKVDLVTATGDTLTFSGVGTVTKYQVDGGKGVKVTTPNSVLYNKAGSSVYGGDDDVNRGETVTMNSSGTSTVQADEAKKNQNNTGGNNTGGSTGGNTGGNNTGGSNSGGNTGGNTGGSTGGNTGGSTGVQPISPELYLSYPADAVPSDFGHNSEYSLADFGSGIGYDSTTGKLTGTVKYLDGFKWYVGTSNEPYATGYYIPLVLDASVSSTAGILTAGSATFNSSVISSGVRYNGKWICYIALDPESETKTIDVSYDPDGALTNFGAGKVTVDYTEVVFVGEEIPDSELYGDATGASLLERVEIPTVVFDSERSTSTEFYYSMSTKDLVKCHLETGRYSYWAGLKLPVRTDIASASITTISPSGAKSSSVVTPITSDDSRYLNLITEVVPSEQGVWKFDMTWIVTSDSTNKYNSITVFVDNTSCVVSTDSEENPVVSGVSLATVSDSDVTQYGKLEDFAINYKVSGNAIRASVVYLEQPGALGSPGYYLPVKINFSSVATDTSISFNEVTLATLKSGADSSVTLMIPVSAAYTGANDIVLTFNPSDEESFNSVEYVIDCSSVTCVSGALILKADTPAGVESYLSGDISYELFSGMLTVSGDAIRQPSGESFGLDYSGNVWVVPVDVVVKSKEADWVLSIVGADGLSQELPASTFVNGSGTVYLPVACTSTRTSVILSVKVGDEIVGSAVVYYTGEFLEFTPAE